MPAHIAANKHAQIVALLETGAGISETARKCQVSRPTVYAVKAEIEERNTLSARPALTKMQVMEHVRTIGESDSSRAVDKLGAWKLYAMMMGYLTEKEAHAAAVNINLLGSGDIRVLENEYKELMGRPLGAAESPTTHDLAHTEPLPLGDAQSRVLEQPRASKLATVEEIEVEGGPIPPAHGGDGI